jgi:hypothetical protein
MRERRLELGKTVVELVEEARVSRSTWRQLEAAQRSRLTAPVGLKIDNALGWSHGKASTIFELADTDYVMNITNGDPLIAHITIDDDGNSATPDYRGLINQQLGSINDRLATLQEQPTWIDELLGAWRQLSPRDRETFLRLIRLAAASVSS